MNGNIGCGGDIALVSDSSAAAFVRREGHVYTLVDLIELRPTKGSPLKLSAVVAEFAAKMRQHKVTSITADGHSREPAREYAQLEKITIESAPEGNEGKWSTYLALQQAMKEGKFRMPEHARLTSQLRSIVSKPKSGGGYIISSPRRAGSGHGDLVSALVLAVHAASNGGGPSMSEVAAVNKNRPHAYRSFPGGPRGRGF